MKIQALVLSGLGSCVLGSCVPNQVALDKAKKQQYTIMAKNEDTINQYAYSTLKPNGKLSSIEGKEILYFLTPGDSVAYDKAHRLSNGIIKNALEENQNRTLLLSNNYFRLKAATDGYYKAMLKESSDNRHFMDLYADYKNTSKDLDQNYTILSKEARNSYKKRIKRAYKESERIRNYARKKLGVVVRRMP